MGIALITNNILSDSGTAIAGLVPTSRTISTTAPLTGGGDLSADRTIAIPAATSAVNGYLTSADWTTFNAKQAAGDYITSLTGEATAAGPGAAAVTLNNASVTGKVLTGVNITGGTVLATDTMLTAFGKLQNQINGLIGSTIYQGVWNASTNTPTLTSSVGTNGFYYIVNVAGNTNLDGITDWKIGDWAIFNGGVWQKVDNTESVTSINGFTGAVSLTTDNIAEGTTNLYFSNARARAAISLTVTGASGASTYNNTTGVLNVPTYTLAGLGGQPLATNLTSLAGLTFASTAFVKMTAAGTFALDTTAYGTGTVTSVAALTLGTTGTDLSSSVATGTTTPVITLNVPTASATNRGALSAADWTTFNNKQNALTNPVTGTGTTNKIPKFTGASTLGNSIITEASSAITVSGAAADNYVASFLNTDTGTASAGIYVKSNGPAFVTEPISMVGGITLNSSGSASFSGDITANKYIKVGGTASQFLMADGSVTTGSFGDYLPLAGGTMTGNVNWGQTDRGITWAFNTDGASIKFYNTGDGDTDSRLEFATIDNNNEYFRWVHIASGVGLYESMRLVPNSSGNAQLTVSGAGTFTSSVTAGGAISTSGTGLNASVRISNTTATTGRDWHLYSLNNGAFGLYNNTNSLYAYYVFANGNIGINTTTDAGYKLDVNGTGRFSGNVGLRVAPDSGYTLTVAGETLIQGGGLGPNYATLLLKDVSSGGSQWGIFSGYPALGNFTIRESGVENRFVIAKTTGNVGIGTVSPQATLDVRGKYYAITSVADNIFEVINSDTTNGYGLYVRAGGTASNRYVARFKNAADSDVMWIDKGGNVGIGTTSPSNLLHLYGTDGNSYLRWTSDVATTGTRLGYNGTEFRIDQQQNADVTIRTNGSERMRITSGGNVLIGTTTDGGARLQVAGVLAMGTTGTNYIRMGVFPNSTTNSGEAWIGRAADRNAGTMTVQLGGGSASSRSFEVVDFAWSVVLFSVGSNGNGTFNGSVTATSFFESSDKTIKTLIQDNYQSKGIESVTAKLYTKNGKQELGYYAQDVQGILPSAVSKGADGLLSLSYREVHTAKIARLEKELEELKAKLN